MNEIDAKKKAAFYNPAQVINRDLSLAVIQRYVDTKKAADPEANITYLEVGNASVSCFFPSFSFSLFFFSKALSASGLRSIRVARETTGLSKIIANDLEEVAVKQIKRNLGKFS